MKKMMIGLLSLLMLAGCGSSKAPKDVKEAVDKNYNLLVGFGDSYNDLYDLESTCYDGVGKSKKCGRILKEPADDMSIMLKDGAEYLTIYLVKGKVTSIQYTVDDAVYGINKKDGYEVVSLMPDKISDWCTHTYKGDKRDNECEDDRKTEYEKPKKQYEAMLAKLDINEKELVAFAEWVYENDGEALKEKVIALKDTQKPLTAAEVKKVLTSYMITAADGGIELKDKYSSLVMLYINNNKTIVLTESSIQDMSLYVYDDGVKLASSKNQKCVVDIKTNEPMKDTTCSELEKENAKSINFQFEYFLTKNRLTFDELMNFFAQYAR